eukprot:UN23164
MNVPFQRRPLNVEKLQALDNQLRQQILELKRNAEMEKKLRDLQRSERQRRREDK